MNQPNQIVIKLRQGQLDPRVIPCLASLLVLFCCYQLALLTWKVVPQPVAMSVAVVLGDKSSARNAQQQQSLTPLLNRHLFGQADDTSTQARLAPKTQLPINLVGVLFSDVPKQSLAVITGNGHQQVYGLGDTIDGTHATLKQVYLSYVVIRRAGHDELLYLPNSELTSELTSPRPTPENQAQSDQPPVLPVAKFLNDPAKLNQFLVIIPQYAGKYLKGYQLTPGPDGQLFKQLGFQPGDLAVSINGYSLNDTQSVMKVVAQLPHLSACQVVVIRHGIRRTIDVRLSS
ncbi:type II secretion system protein GspC [Celerinatantimonas yamalensis]|uniref:Type II secretion system protein GspC n=1 Tax=Celerinatantimonas yamalensis TaxID=559956 RepID=A0ABW9G6W9_9GAMM